MTRAHTDTGRILTDADRQRLGDGTHTRLYEVLGAHPDQDGTTFRVWAPNARSVSVVGDFNGWDGAAAPMFPTDSGVWEHRVDGAQPGQRYKYRVVGPGGDTVDKADPFAFHAEEPPATASVVWDLRHDWADDGWMAERGRRGGLDAPVSIYEVHLGSWRRDGPVSYAALAPRLADHCDAHGFTHVELLPVMEHPFYGSWGYQTTSYFAPSCRWGSPQDLMGLIDLLHQRGIGVLLDWVPSHFPADEHALARFDGTHLFEHADPRLGFHPDWNSLIFNYDRHEVRAFLTSSAVFWLDRYHADGLRVDAVASMLYRDYSRAEGEWIPNEHGGRENLGAISFMQQMNTAVYAAHPDVHTYAEESTAWPGVTTPVHDGGLGFGFKWDMGWMHDTLQYMGRDPIHRRHHHNEITFRAAYAASENYALPLSHDEVVHGKGSLLARMPGDEWQRFANVRLLLGLQWAQPGKKLLFMGAEFAHPAEWNHDTGLDWSMAGEGRHGGVGRWVGALNRLYRSEPALHRGDCDPAGFRWIVGDDQDNSVFAWARLDPGGAARPVVVVANATPAVHESYRVGVPAAGAWQELANGDDEAFGGSGATSGGDGALVTEPVAAHGFDQSLSLRVPPLAVVFLAPGGASDPDPERP